MLAVVVGRLTPRRHKQQGHQVLVQYHAATHGATTLIALLRCWRSCGLESYLCGVAAFWQLLHNQCVWLQLHVAL